MAEEYNPQLCQERHDNLKEWSDDMEQKLQKVSNRFIAMLAGLTLNLTGVIILLIIQLAKMPQ